MLADWPVKVCEDGHTGYVPRRARARAGPGRRGTRSEPSGRVSLGRPIGGQESGPSARRRRRFPIRFAAMAKATKVRLDTLLARRGVFESRTRAAASVLAGEVLLGAERRRADKPGQLVTEDVSVAVDEAPEFVSRGGRKLASALAATGVDPAGRRALDAGASTGGFTDCLLQRGAAHVVAVDVAYGELHWRLRNDPRVTVMERVNARELEPAQLPYAPDLVVADLSFIGLAKVLPALVACAAERFDCLALVKPQFEAGREHVGRGGVVREPAARRAALVGVGKAARRLGVTVLGFASSELPGPKGNLETFVWLAEAGREGAVSDVEAAAREVEP
jgi:23S rRNA (cytidine1920-2'-O)/16S rRNA (cytidine1409-2'-O)-methyltransferase